ncbi:MAG: hypothetical protein CSA11_10505 [Chloroflexi bacterium]|nr:MAG: hypothetical protein CSA11_10505 [Chloroflexota bacterium]
MKKITIFAQAKAPYNNRGERIVRHADNSIFLGSGNQTILNIQQTGDRYAATFNVTLDLS